MLYIPTDKSWTLFLDRDGVINQRIPNAYVRHPREFEFLPGTLGALAVFEPIFSRIIIVTNQQGVGKGLMTEQDLGKVHEFMRFNIEEHGGRIDAIYACTELASLNPHCRKPNPGMGEQAKAQFPDIDFSRSVMVGDSISDIQFGKNLGMKTVFLEGKLEDEVRIHDYHPDLICEDLWVFSELIQSPVKNILS